MAIPHFRGNFISAGKSPLAMAAYNHREPMKDVALGQRFQSKSDHDMVHAEIAIPLGSPAWLVRLKTTGTPNTQSAALWNTVVANEREQLAQTARTFIVALPRELTIAQNVDLVRDYVDQELTGRGFVVDWVLHVDPDSPGNPHVHIMHTLRPLTDTGFGPKRIALLDDGGAVKRNEQGRIVYRQFIGGRGDLVDLRTAWAATATRHLAVAGHDFVLDLRSYKDQRIALTPTTHIGPNGSARKRQEFESDAWDAHQGAKDLSAAQIDRDPGCVIRLVAQQQSVFNARDIARTIHTFIDHEVPFTRALDRAMAQPDLVVLATAELDAAGRVVTPAQYTTPATQALEARMSEQASAMASRRGAALPADDVTAILAGAKFTLSDEQVGAIRHITERADMASIVGFAGAGKSTLLRTAAHAWHASGRQVLGGAISNKVSKDLAEGAGIHAQSVARWVTLWSHGREQLSANSVFVLDEAGMVGSADMASIVSEVTRAGGKLVLVGDPEQLQPIAAGGAFRVLVEQCGAFELAGVRRQHDDWARAATIAFQRGDVTAAVDAYAAQNAITFAPDRVDAAQALVKAYLDGQALPNRNGRPGTQVALAHRNDDILLLNTAIHEGRGQLGQLGDDVTLETRRGPRKIAAGDRLQFLKNTELDLAAGGRSKVSNSDLGTVRAIAFDASGPVLTVALDGSSQNSKIVRFAAADYADFDLGYATTIHKTQGATLDRAFVLASSSMDKPLAYVAMSRHRDSVSVYVPQTEIADIKALTWSFGRTTPKLTTLDYADKRGLTPKPRVPAELSPMLIAGQAMLAAARHALEIVKARYETAVAVLKQRLLPQQIASITPAASSKKSSGAALMTSPQRSNAPPASGRTTEVVLATQERLPKRQNIFAGFKPNPQHAGIAASAVVRSRIDIVTPLMKAADQYAAETQVIVAVTAMKLQPTADTEAALKTAKARLEAIQLGVVAVLERALQYDPKTRAAMAAPGGPHRGAALVAGIEREQAATLDPLIRADRLIDQLISSHNTVVRLEREEKFDALPLAKHARQAAITAIARDARAQAAMRDNQAALRITPDGWLAQALVQPSFEQALMRALDPPVIQRGPGMGY